MKRIRKDLLIESARLAFEATGADPVSVALAVDEFKQSCLGKIKLKPTAEEEIGEEEYQHTVEAMRKETPAFLKYLLDRPTTPIPPPDN